MILAGPLSPRSHIPSAIVCCHQPELSQALPQLTHWPGLLPHWSQWELDHNSQPESGWYMSHIYRQWRLGYNQLPVTMKHVHIITIYTTIPTTHTHVLHTSLLKPQLISTTFPLFKITSRPFVVFHYHTTSILRPHQHATNTPSFQQEMYRY